MNNTKILCIGDSITFGYETEEAQNWTTLLGDDLGVEVINRGLNGDTTAGMLARFQRHVIDQKPSHVIVTGGTNDLWFGLKDELIISNIFTMARQAKFIDIVPVIGIPTPCFNLNELNFVQEDYAECIRSFQNTLISFCNEKEIAFIDFSVNMDRNHFLEDGLHINKVGQKLMVKNAKSVLMKLISF